MEWTKDPVHVKVIGIIALIRAGLCLIAALVFGVLVSFLSSFLPQAFQDPQVRRELLYFVEALISFIPFILIIVVILNIIAGVLLLRQRKGGKVMGILVSVLALFNFPVGTIIGIYSLLVLLDKDITSVNGEN